MKNIEKYADVIADALSQGCGFKNGKLVMCKEINCPGCDLYSTTCGEKDSFAKWLNAEYKEPEVDWSTVPKGSRIEVEGLGGGKQLRYFSHYENYKVYYFSGGATEWSGCQVCSIEAKFVHLVDTRNVNEAIADLILAVRERKNCTAEVKRLKDMLEV